MKTLLVILTLAITTSAQAFEETSGDAFETFVLDTRNAWALLGSIDIIEEGTGADWKAVKTFPAAVLDARDDFEIAGYLVPVLAEAEITNLMLVPEPSNCPFCGVGSGYGTLIEVSLKRGITGVVEGSLLRVRGRLELIESPDTMQAFRLVDAVSLEIPGY